MDNIQKDELIKQYKKMRMDYFNLFEEDIQKFDKHYKEHPLYEIVLKHFDKSFTQVNQLAIKEIEKLLEKNI